MILFFREWIFDLQHPDGRLVEVSVNFVKVQQLWSKQSVSSREVRKVIKQEGELKLVWKARFFANRPKRSIAMPSRHVGFHIYSD
jgi:hypothetical protein